MEQEQTSTPQPSQPATTQYNPIPVGEWVITLLIIAIPLVGLIMLFIWGFGESTHPSKKNFARAALIWTAIGIVLYILIFAVFGALFFSNMDSFN